MEHHPQLFNQKLQPTTELPMAQELGKTMLTFARQEGTDGAEIFTTVQGEGRNIGSPVVFLRLSGCNLQCTWCDTPYTWNWEGTNFPHDKPEKYNRENEQVRLEIGEAVDQITGFPIKRLVITGGEPLQQKKNLVPFLKQLREKQPEQWVEIETNGTIAPGAELAELVDQFNVSPKLENSGNELKRRSKEAAMKAFVALPKADFKFVVFGENDLAEILELVEQFKIPHERVYLMPEGRTEEEVKEHQLELVEIAKEHNFNLTTRLHVLIWGAVRGK